MLVRVESLHAGYGATPVLRNVSLEAHPETSLRQRLGEAHDAKRAIAAWAAGQVKRSESVLLDAGSTVESVSIHASIDSRAVNSSARTWVSVDTRWTGRL